MVTLFSSNFFSYGVKGLFRKLSSFALLSFVLTGVFVSPFLFFEEVSNYNYFKIVSTVGELPISKLNEINGVEGVYLSVGLGYSLTGLNDSDVLLVWILGYSDIISKQYIESGTLPDSKKGVLVGGGIEGYIGEKLYVNGSEYVIAGFLSDAFLSEVLDYQWSTPFIVVFEPLGDLKVVFAWFNIFSNPDHIKSRLAEICGEHSMIIRKFYASNSDSYSVLLITLSSFLATFAVVFLYFHRNKREYAVLLGTGWKVRHISRVFYLRYSLVFVISYILSLFFVYIIVNYTLSLHFFTNIYLVFPIPTLALNLIFSTYFIKSFSQNFIEVLNN